jgi:hypothetical protein
MVTLSSSLPGRIRIKHRKAVQASGSCPSSAPTSVRLDAKPAEKPRLPLVEGTRRRQPSLLDPELTGDPWFEDLGFGLWALCLDDACLACIRGVDLDRPSLNRLLDRVWKRPPRRRR